MFCKLLVKRGLRSVLYKLRVLMVSFIILVYYSSVTFFWGLSGQKCQSHQKLSTLYGRPDFCSNSSHIILPCPNEHLDFLDDPSVLSACRVRQTFDKESTLQLASKETFRYVIPTPNCNTAAEILLSFREDVKRSSTVERDLVPNIVHYISLGCSYEFRFLNYLSVLSVDKFVQPERIIFHGDCPPRGEWWERALSQIPNIYFRQHQRIQTIQGRQPRWIEHESDIIRLRILLAEGGIYLDSDVVVLKSLEPLRKYPISMGSENGQDTSNLGNSFIMAKPNANFVCLWLYAYREYFPMQIHAWNVYSVMAPGRIGKRFPHLVNIEQKSIFSPIFYNFHKLYNGFHDWSGNYVMHMWNTMGMVHLLPKSPGDIPEMVDVRNTVDEIYRYIYFNEKVITARLCQMDGTVVPPEKMIKCHNV